MTEPARVVVLGGGPAGDVAALDRIRCLDLRAIPVEQLEERRLRAGRAADTAETDGREAVLDFLGRGAASRAGCAPLPASPRWFGSACRFASLTIASIRSAFRRRWYPRICKSAAKLRNSGRCLRARTFGSIPATPVSEDREGESQRRASSCEYRRAGASCGCHGCRL